MCAVTLGDNVVTKELHSLPWTQYRCWHMFSGTCCHGDNTLGRVCCHVKWVWNQSTWTVFYFCHVIVTIQWILVWLKLLGEKSCNRLLAALVSKGQLIQLFSLFNHALYLLLNLLLLLLMKLLFHNCNISVWGYSCSVLNFFCS